MAPTHKQVIESVGVDTIVQMIARGTLMADIARALGVPIQSVSLYARKHPDYEDAVAAHHTARLDDVEQLHDDALTSRDYDLARGRMDQWRLRQHRAAVASAAHREPKGPAVAVQVNLSADAALSGAATDLLAHLRGETVDNLVDNPCAQVTDAPK